MGKERVMTAIVVIEGVVIVLLAVLVAGLLRSHAEILRQLDRLGAGDDASTPVGSPRPRTIGFGEAPMKTIVGTTPRGAERTISLDHGRAPTLLAFLSSGCASCQVFWSELAGHPEQPLPDTRTVVVTKGSDGETPSKIASLAPPTIDVLMSSEVWDEFRVPLTPYFVLLDPEARVIGEGSALTWDQLLGLLRQSAADSPDPTQLDTPERARFTDSRLAQSGVEPGDPSLYENPLDR
jgi:hypothetical protein